MIIADVEDNVNIFIHSVECHQLLQCVNKEYRKMS